SLRVLQVSVAARRRSAGDHQVDRFRTLAFLVGLDLELDALSFVQRLQSGLFDCGDVDEHVAPAVVRFDEAVPAFDVEELDRTAHGHRTTPSPTNAPPPTPTARRLGQTFTSEEGISPQRPQ